MSHKLLPLKFVTRSLAVCLLLCGTALVATAQSGDINAPTPIRKSDVLGRIAARDLGDARLTNHYYSFAGTPGDLLITIQSRNLNGDIDVFTAGSLRPLLKLSLYAESTAPVTKGIYLRRREDLILRIEARSPDDNEGTYQIIFSGSFEAIAGGPDIAENETPSTDSSTAPNVRRGSRVNSAGARIKEPEPPVTEVAVAPTPEPTPEATPVESPSPKATRKTPARTTTENARTRRPAGRRSTTSTPAPKPKPVVEETKPSEEAKTEEAKTEEAKPANTEPEVATTPKPKPRGRGNTPRSGTTARPAKTTKPETPTEAPAETPPEAEAEAGPRLIIETNDGTLINRSMSTVRRVTVENGWVVIVAQKSGKVDRVLLANVVKMTIQP